MKIIFFILLSVLNNSIPENAREITITHNALNLHDVYQFEKVDPKKWKFKFSSMPDGDLTIHIDGMNIILEGTYQKIKINKTFKAVKGKIFPDEYNVSIERKKNAIIYTYKDKDQSGPPVARAFGTYEVKWKIQ